MARLIQCDVVGCGATGVLAQGGLSASLPGRRAISETRLSVPPALPDPVPSDAARLRAAVIVAEKLGIPPEVMRELGDEAMAGGQGYVPVGFPVHVAFDVCPRHVTDMPQLVQPADAPPYNPA